MASEEPRLIGIGILGSKPFGRTFLRLGPGVFVIYGVNGAGKTKLLEAIDFAAGGRRRPGGVERDTTREGRAIRLFGAPSKYSQKTPPQALLYFVASPPNGTEYSVLYDGLRSEALKKWELATHVGRVEQLWDIEEWISAESTPVDAVRAIVALELPERWRQTELVDEVVDQHRFAIAEGRLRYIAALISDDTPHLRNVWAESRHYAETLRDAASSSHNAHGEELFKKVLGVQSDENRPLLSLRSAFDVAFGHEPPPAWVPDVITSAGECVTEPFAVLDETPVPLVDLTLIYLRHSFRHSDEPRRLLTGVDGSVAVNDEAQSAAAALSATASEIAEILMLDAPVLRCEFRDPEVWAGQDAIHWLAFDRPSLTWVPLDVLGRAQQRWSEFSVKVALAEAQGTQPGLVIVDEPEEALHARAERHLAIGLHELADRLDAPVLVATHSAELLRDNKAHLHFVTRDSEGLITARPMPRAIRDHLDELGLDVADTLQLTRVFVIVEGHHDELILGALLGPELNRERATVVPMGGARQLAAVLDSQLIFDFTSAATLTVLDNVGAEHARRVWDEARRSAAAGDASGARRSLEAGFSGRRSHEERFLREFLSKAVVSGQFDRVGVVGLGAADIVEYLPVGDLVPGATSWGDLHSEHASHSGISFKAWLARDRQADFSDDALLRAAGALDRLPEEFGALLEECRRVATQSSSRPDTAST